MNHEENEKKQQEAEKVLFYQGTTRLSSPPFIHCNFYIFSLRLDYDESILPSNNFTLITTITIDDFSYLSILSSLWKASTIFSIYLPKAILVEDFEYLLSLYTFPSNMLLIVRKQQDEDKGIPYSEMTNLAIQYCQTTHYMIIDPGLLFYCICQL